MKFIQHSTFNIQHFQSIQHFRGIQHLTFNIQHFLIFVFLNFCTLQSGAQSDSCTLQISLLTCSPGQELYSTFGHTAIRVKDSVTATDIVFNYGTFDDSDPYFYLKFTRGVMRYALSVQSFNDFMQEFMQEHRGVTEQILLLDCNEKMRLLHALQINAEEENRFYNYHFYADNCTTRARDIISRNTSSPVVFRNILPEKHPTVRQLIHSYLDKGEQYWSKLGIDMCLGWHLDTRVTNEEAMFLPDYLMTGFDSAQLNNRPLVGEKQTVLSEPVQQKNSKTLFTPFIVFLILFLAICVLSFVKREWSAKALRLFDGLFFLLLGLLGIFILLLWIIRIDTVCRNNLNLLWALPTHLPVAFVLHKNKSWVRNYFKIVFVLNSILIITWFILPQHLNISFIPVALLIIFRSWFLSKKY